MCTATIPAFQNRDGAFRVLAMPSPPLTLPLLTLPVPAPNRAHGGGAPVPRRLELEAGALHLQKAVLLVAWQLAAAEVLLVQHPQTGLGVKGNAFSRPKKIY